MRNSTFLCCISSEWIHVVTFEFVHQSGPESFDLFGGSDSQEGNLCKSLLFELSEADASDHLRVVFEDNHRLMIPIED